MIKEAKIILLAILLIAVVSSPCHAVSGFFVCKIIGGMPSGIAESGYIGFSYVGEMKTEKERYGMYLITGTTEQIGKMKILPDCTYLGAKDETLVDSKPVETKPSTDTAQKVSDYAAMNKIPIYLDKDIEEKAAVLEVIKLVNPGMKSVNEAQAVDEVVEVKPIEEPKPIEEEKEVVK